MQKEIGNLKWEIMEYFYFYLKASSDCVKYYKINQKLKNSKITKRSTTLFLVETI